jgi:3-deoxy-D-manno-octulosonate 8-phosphate phosphatase (KDO 8-P phosphatase)
MIDITKIDLIVFDFDGVLTDNKVLVDQNGNESVSCSRSDGLGFDVLKILRKSAYIISTEKNLVVSARAKKLNIPVLQGVRDKSHIIKNISKEKNVKLSKILFVGNDLNDYYAMQLCGYSACPSDSHPKIKDIASFVLKTKGGNGVLRELLEEVFELNVIEILYK